MMRRISVSQQPTPAEMWISEEDTQPLVVLAGLAFRTFLARYELSRLDVALAAGVRLLTVWNIEHDNPIPRQHAERICAGLYHLTGVRYRGRITLRLDCVSHS